jgi:hypothetical protein
MHYFDSNEIKILQKSLLEKEYFEAYGNSDYISGNNENEEFSSKRINTRINIDFFTENVKIHLVFPPKKKKENKIQNDENVQTELYVAPEQPKNMLIVDKTFKIAEDFESINIDGKTHLIPKYFNVELIKNNDEKTFEMIFYKIFYDEIIKKINEFSLK